jgi:hypothetical protein
MYSKGGLKQHVDHKTDSCDDPRQPAGPNELVSQAEEQPLLDVEPGVKPIKNYFVPTGKISTKN